MKSVNSGSMKFRNYSANYCTLVKFFRLSEGKTDLFAYPIVHSFNKYQLSAYRVPGSTPDVRDLADPQSPHRPFPRGVYDPERAALGRTAPCLGRYCLTLASLNLPRRIDFYFTTVSKAGLIKCLSV